jgi:hypothetical protein
MGSVIDAIECPKCKYKEASIETYYKTGNEEIFCAIVMELVAIKEILKRKSD